MLKPPSRQLWGFLFTQKPLTVVSNERHGVNPCHRTYQATMSAELAQQLIQVDELRLY